MVLKRFGTIVANDSALSAYCGRHYLDWPFGGVGGSQVSRTDNVIQKGPAIDWQGLLILPSLGVLLDRDYVGCTRAFFALSDHELDFLSFVERCIARCLDFRVVDKQVIAAAIRGDKTKSLT